MSEKIDTPKVSKKVKSNKWDNVQKFGFWFLITVLVSYWSGVYLGGMAVEQNYQKIDQAKTSAVESFKATSKTQE